MKAALALLMAIGLGGAALYYGGGFASFNPSEQGRKARAALLPGMSFKQACDITGSPSKFRIINRKVSRINGVDVVHMVPAPPVSCTQERIAERLAEGSLPHGFLCTFNYSAEVAFGVEYDETGSVVSVQDLMTLANWMNN